MFSGRESVSASYVAVFLETFWMQSDVGDMDTNLIPYRFIFL